MLCLKFNVFKLAGFRTLRALLLLGHVALFNGSLANEGDQDKADRTESALPQMAVVEESPWEFGIGVGRGVMSNPMVQSEDIDIPAVLHIAYYGERFFFDNGDLGFTLISAQSWSFNVIAGINRERYYFDYLNRFGLVLNNTAGSDPDFAPIDNNAVANNQQQPIEPPKRSRPIDGGLEWLYGDEWGEVQLQWTADITGKHSGHELWLGYSLPLQSESWSFTPSFGLKYKSSAWTNYFYGVREDEVVVSSVNGDVVRPAYAAEAATNYWWRLSANYAITEHLRLVAWFEKEKLDDSINKSPIVNEDNSHIRFVGVYYQF